MRHASADGQNGVDPDRVAGCWRSGAGFVRSEYPERNGVAPASKLLRLEISARTSVAEQFCDSRPLDTALVQSYSSRPTRHATGLSHLTCRFRSLKLQPVTIQTRRNPVRTRLDAGHDATRYGTCYYDRCTYYTPPSTLAWRVYRGMLKQPVSKGLLI